uniref:acyltransferase family protein n=1 Tax=Klebsiella aerogenes TaxID=548 RepID=UPI001F27B8FD|nr:acyltransferase [Klebsiella aerogenes]
MILEKTRRKFESIQFLRFIAAFLVLITHSTFYVHERYDQSVRVIKEGSIGVDIFFVISGFVILLSSIKRDGGFEDGLSFTIKRLIRIVPMYWIATTVKVIALVAVPAAVLHATLDPERIIMSYFFLPSVTPDGRWEPILGVGWTLVFEMFFYLLFALALFARKNPVYLSSFVILSFSAISTMRTPEWPVQTMYLDKILLYFVIGMLCYILIAKTNRKTMRVITYSLLSVSAIFLVRKITYHEPLITRLSFETFVFVTTFFLSIIQCESLFRGWLAKVTGLFGDASYSTYLFHPLIAPVVPAIFSKLSNNGLHINPMFVIVVTIAVAFATTILIHILIEKRITGILKKALNKTPTENNLNNASSSILK